MMTDAGEKLEQRMMNYGILAECQEAALELVRAELERAAEEDDEAAELLEAEAKKHTGMLEGAFNIRASERRKSAAAIRKLKE